MGIKKSAPSVIGRNLRRIRLSRGLTARALSSASGVGRQTIMGLEHGYEGQGNPGAKTLAALAAPLGCSVAELFREPRRKKRA